MSWPMVKLGEVATLVNGRAYKKHEMLAEGKYPLMRVGNFFSNREWYYSDLELPDRQYCEKGDLLYAWSASFGPRIWDGGKVIYHYHIWKLILDESKVYKKYLYYALQRDVEFIKQEQGSGSTMVHVTKTAMENREIPLPPLDEQKRIAAILDKADAIRRKRQQAIQLADDFLKSVFLDMFGDPVTNPKGWEVKKLGEILRIRRGASPRPIKEFLGGTVPWIKIGDGSKGDQIYLYDTKEHVTEAGAQKSVFLEEGALIFANCGVSLGFARILKKAGCIHDGWLAFDQINEDFNKIFLLKWLNQLTQYFRGIAPDGTQPNLNTAIMKEQKLICPPYELQKKYESVVFKTDLFLNKLKNNDSLSDEFFYSLSQKAFAGEL